MKAVQNGTEWKHANISIPTSLFRNNERIKPEILERAPWTYLIVTTLLLRRNEPLDKEVAVDPEMLGKVFENIWSIYGAEKQRGILHSQRDRALHVSGKFDPLSG